MTAVHLSTVMENKDLSAISAKPVGQTHFNDNKSERGFQDEEKSANFALF